MTNTTTQSRSDTFTLVHAKYLASKVTTDMTRCHQLYGFPSTLEAIDRYGTELALMLKAGYVSKYEFGFKKDEKRVLSWLYEVKGSSLEGGDQRPGGIVSGVSIADAKTFNFMTYSAAYSAETSEKMEAFKKTLPFIRSSGSSPTDGSGYWVEEKAYSAAGTLVTRRNFRPY